MKTDVRLWKLAVNSSRRNCISSTMSSSDHLRVQRFLAKGKRCATSMAGRLAFGALVTRFWKDNSGKVMKVMEPTRKVATITRITFSLTAA